MLAAEALSRPSPSPLASLLLCFCSSAEHTKLASDMQAEHALSLPTCRLWTEQTSTWVTRKQRKEKKRKRNQKEKIEKKKKSCAVRRHNGSPQTWEQPGLAYYLLKL